MTRRRLLQIFSGFEHPGNIKNRERCQPATASEATFLAKEVMRLEDFVRSTALHGKYADSALEVTWREEEGGDV